MNAQHIRRTHKVSTDKTVDNTADLEHLTNSHHHGAGEPVPEADMLEQLTPVDPAVDPVDTPAAGGPTWAASRPNRPVDEADWLEQQLTVPAIEEAEDYPPDLGGSLDHPGF
jgi:hypothetical protein